MWIQVFRRPMTANLHMLIAHGADYIRWNFIFKVLQIYQKRFFFIFQLVPEWTWNSTWVAYRGVNRSLQQRCEARQQVFKKRPFLEQCISMDFQVFCGKNLFWTSTERYSLQENVGIRSSPSLWINCPSGKKTNCDYLLASNDNYSGEKEI